MTAVTGTSIATASAKPVVSKELNANMDYDSFLKLFMAQLRNQDPTKPNDPTATLSQLASFSNVEQSIRLNGKLDSLLAASNATMASALVGKELSSLDGSISGTALNVEITEKGITAKLKDGRVLELSSGYRIGSA